MRNDIPRVVIGAVSSGSGKTTIVTGILSALRQRGLNVQSYKIGPDYIDPGYHKLASGNPAHNLDSWLMPQEKLKEVFCRTAENADIAIIEGVMGLYDGGRKGVSSTAEIAKLLDAPVILVIDAKSMGASAAAIALGFKMYDPDVKLAGVILNRLGSPTHKTMIEKALKDIGIDVFGAVRRDDNLTMPERHLGLLPVEENSEQEIVDKIGEAIGSQVDLDEIMKLAETQFSIDIDEFEEDENEDVPQKKIKIAVAKDDAFSFYYPESIRVLEKCGAEIVNFSPLKDKKLPKCDGVILGGGFPEMFAEELQANVSMQESLRKAVGKGKPVYAECGGFMYLTEGLTDFDDVFHPMTGIIPVKVQMNKKLQMVGYVEAKMELSTVLGEKDTVIKGHEFHFSSEITEENKDMQGFERAFTFTRMRNNATYPAGFVRDNVLGSYLHIHFIGCPESAQCFVDKCRENRRKRKKE